MRRLVIAAVAVAVVGAEPAGAKLSKTAYFRVDIRAYQFVEWYDRATITGCSNSVTSVDAQGTGDVLARDLEDPWVVARRRGDAATLLVHDEGPALAVGGDVSRHGEVHAVYLRAPDDPRACMTAPETAQSDCGTQLLPKGAVLYLSYARPRLSLSGPNVPDWAGMPFKFCPGANGDSILAASWYEPGGATTTAPLALTKLFGKTKSFTVKYHDRRTVQTAHPGGAVASEDHPVTTTIDWFVKFTRIKPQLASPEL